MLAVDLGPGVRAGFTLRTGGVSRGVHASLNLGLHVGDDPDAVRANRARVRDWVGAPVGWANQVHGRSVVWSDGAERDAAGRDSLGDADAVLARSGHGAGVMVADCVPVLLAAAGDGLVAAVHAGRRGVELGVVAAAVAALVGAGARPERLRAHVGPAVCGRCYEVPEQMRDEVAARVPQAWAVTRQGTPALDLPAAVAAQLAAAGVGRVDRTDVCTVEDARFYSHRRDGASGTGRFAGVVAHRAPGSRTAG